MSHRKSSKTSRRKCTAPIRRKKAERNETEMLRPSAHSQKQSADKRSATNRRDRNNGLLNRYEREQLQNEKCSF